MSKFILQISKNSIQKITKGLLQSKIILLEKTDINISLKIIIKELIEDFHFFYDHPAYSDGIYTCQITNIEPKSSPERIDLLRLHSDMSMVDIPPEITAIRLISKNNFGGENNFLSIQNLIDHLKKTDPLLLNWLNKNHKIKTLTGNIIEAPLISKSIKNQPIRLWSGLNKFLIDSDPTKIEKTISHAENISKKTIEINMNQGDLLIFSNYHWLHSRKTCFAPGRCTEVCLGSISKKSNN
jgi:hypothetical protein